MGLFLNPTQCGAVAMKYAPAVGRHVQGARRPGPLMQEHQAVAAALEALCRSSYGPAGGRKLVAGDALVLLPSAAGVLREVRPTGPAMAPYISLVSAVQAHVGDGATGALLVAAGLVRRAVDGVLDGHPMQAYLDGYALARRQCLAWLEAEFQPASPARALAHVAPLLGPVQDLVEGLPPGPLDLARIDIRTEPGGRLGWLDGLVVTPRNPIYHHPASGREGVLLVQEVMRFKPRAGGVVRDAAVHAAVAHHEAARRRACHDAIAGMDVGLLVTPGALDEELADQLESSGILVVTSASKPLVERLEVATGARLGQGWHDAVPGRARLERRKRDWLVRGAGPGATLVVPAQTDLQASLHRDEAERFLRALGATLQSPGGVPGGGRWQRGAADSMARARDHAPAKAALGLEAARRVLAGLADALVANAGLDPMDQPLLPDAPEVIDPAIVVRTGVDVAFAAALQILRVDDRFSKAPSSQRGLRGGDRVGSPRGMPGDIPPLM
jgi:hypothetical protein